MSASLQLREVTKSFATPQGPLVVVEDFDLTVKAGEFVCLVGHSGCGKSTVLSMVAGLSSATSGEMLLGDKKLTGPGPDRGVVFQAPCLLPWLSARGNVRIGVDQVQAHLTKFERQKIADTFLGLVGLGDALDKMPSELSQGMRQRVGLARAFALNPQMLLLDEPFGMLDSLTRMELQQVLLDLWIQDQKTALMVTHDVDEALYLADRIVMMTNGPRAKVGATLHVPFARPRDRHAVLNDPDYYKLREDLLQFLESQSHTSAVPSNSLPARTPSANGRATVPA
jgi:nitrate/nitrite transport system ATP-binding protein